MPVEIFTASDSQQNPVLAGLIASVLIVAVVAMWWFRVRGSAKKHSGWDALRERFPATEVHKPGPRYKRCTGFFGEHSHNSIPNAFLLEFAQEGLLVTPNFAKKLPILIPWPAIREVGIVGPIIIKTFMFLTVDYKTRVSFQVPKDALAALQQNIPADRFQKETLIDGIKTRLDQRSK